MYALRSNTLSYGTIIQRQHENRQRLHLLQAPSWFDSEFTSGLYRKRQHRPSCHKISDDNLQIVKNISSIVMFTIC